MFHYDWPSLVIRDVWSKYHAAAACKQRLVNEDETSVPVLNDHCLDSHRWQYGSLQYIQFLHRTTERLLPRTSQPLPGISPLPGLPCRLFRLWGDWYHLQWYGTRNCWQGEETPYCDLRLHLLPGSGRFCLRCIQIRKRYYKDLVQRIRRLHPKFHSSVWPVQCVRCLRLHFSRDFTVGTAVFSGGPRSKKLRTDNPYKGQIGVLDHVVSVIRHRVVLLVRSHPEWAPVRPAGQSDQSDCYRGDVGASHRSDRDPPRL